MIVFGVKYSPISNTLQNLTSWAYEPNKGLKVFQPAEKMNGASMKSTSPSLFG
ncbi:hypothetical protein Mapa_017647 [Marchantia paleacea]|nr:hypothetical protein Mapa_017647 [Marchantia paleacea]